MDKNNLGFSAEVAIRRIPFPYKAMLAVCSDLDETPDLRTYVETARFLNTNENTAIGQGVGLEVGNTIYFDMPPGQFSYWNTDDRGREVIHALIASGHIDCLHSYGDLALRREHAGRALDSLSRAGCVPRVWVDHGVAPTNFGRDIMQGQGDVVGAEAYHADLTCGAGVEFVWMGRVTSIFGQEVARSWGGLWTWNHPYKSARTLLKEGLKVGFAALGEGKYRLHASNGLLRETGLRDGRNMVEFIRSNPHWAGVSAGDTWSGICQVLNDETLELLEAREGTAILYTHLGKGFDLFRPASAVDASAAFETLAKWHRDGRILVTTTSRLLSYVRMMQQISLGWSQGVGLAGMIEVLTLALDADSLQGLTLYTDNPDQTHVAVRGVEIRGIESNGPDHTGRRSVTVPWRSLAFPNV